MKVLAFFLCLSVYGAEQVPTWTADDMQFFLHGSLGTEVVPEGVLRAFRATYPDLFPSANFGLIPDGADGLPIGFSQRNVPHLAGLPSVGINCASCHVGEIQSHDGQRVRVLGMTAQFDVESFFGAIIVATFRTADPANMKRYLENYLETLTWRGVSPHDTLDYEWKRQESKVLAAIAADPFGSKDVRPGTLHQIAAEDLINTEQMLTRGDLATFVHSHLKLFHNMRAALHVPDVLPTQVPVPNGPGRNDPWRILSYSLLGAVTKPAPVKFGIVWNEDRRDWVHVDANTRSPIIRNLAAALGLGAPLVGHTGVLDFAVVERQTALSQKIRPPKYPWVIDRAAAERGAKSYRQDCAACHDSPVLHPVDTDPNRAEIFTPAVAEGFNKFFGELQIPGYRSPRQPLRSTGKYWSPDLAGVWARAPYLHNGSVRTMEQLLSSDRQTQWHRGSRVYDEAAMGYVDEGVYVLDTTAPGSSNRGHEYGTQLSVAEKHDLIEYLKTK